MKHIRIISPSGVIAPELITQAQARLESWGYCVSIGKNAMQQYGRFAGTIKQRLSDINEALADPNIDIILCSRGGYGLQQIIDQIVLPTRPKTEWPLIVGYSDITALHSLMALHGVPSLQMPKCEDISELTDDDPTLLAMRKALEGKTKKKNILELRRKQKKNAMVFLLQIKLSHKKRKPLQGKHNKWNAVNRHRLA